MEANKVGKTAIGALIRERRIAMNLSQLELAQRIGYKLGNFIGMVEKGGASFPREKVFAFADALGISRAELLEMWLKEYQPDWLKVITFKSRNIR